MLSIRHAVPLLCAAGLMACVDAAGPVGPSLSPSASLLPGLEEYLPGVPVLDPFVEPLSGEGVLEWARGGGHIMFGEEVGEENARRTFAFTAKNRSDGTTQGQFQLNNRTEGPFFKEHGVVTCLEVEGNQAWVGGVVTHTDNPAFVAPYSRVWRVIDNGEGSSNQTDMITLAQSFGLEGTEQVCKTKPELLLAFLQPIEDGNIQVTDGSAP
jgi:hypothetical protein